MNSLLMAALVALTPLSPEQQVRDLIERQRQAWNAGDHETFCSFYAEDAAFISPKGITKGRAEVLARYKKRYPDKKEMGTLSFEYLDIRADETHASVAAKWKLTYAHKPEASGYTLIVWRKVSEKWSLVQDASM